MYETEIKELITEINQLLEANPKFETKSENGYLAVTVQFNKTCNRSFLYVAPNIDETMTLVDLQQLKQHILGEI